MPLQVTNYQCPSCTGPLRFEGSIGKLKCEYCGSTFAVQDIEALYADPVEQAQQASAQGTAQAETQQTAEGNWNWDAVSSDWGPEAAGMKVYSCPSCGAELICDATTAATSCPYCGNPSIVPSQFRGMLKPDFILPFKLDKQAAMTALRNYYRGKRLLPKAFADQNHIQEVKGIYVPFWLFDGKTDANVDYKATRVHSHIRGDRRVTVTEHYAIHRAGSVSFSRIPVDASTKMPDALMDAIEPFDYSELKPFSMAYMPGFLADKYDVEADTCEERADTRASHTTENIIDGTVGGYSSCIPVNKRIQLRRGTVKYALLPVWMLSTQWNGQNFIFAMNGQTGKFIGDLPVSMGRYWSLFASIAAPLAAVLALLMYFL